MASKKLTFLICTLVSVFFFQLESFGQSQTFKTGTAIIDMGSASPTVKNVTSEELVAMQHKH